MTMEPPDGSAAKAIDNAQTEPRKPVPSQFPDKLMMLLDRGTAPEALWWLPDVGTVKGAFAINRKAFTAKLLDTAFNGNKWPSITRNLNRWGYRHVSYPNLPPHTTAYHNPLFQPNRPDLLKTMTQNKSQAKAAIQQLETKQSEDQATSTSRSGSISGRTGSTGTPSDSTSSGQLLSSAQPSLRSSLMLAGVPPSAPTSSQSKLPPPLPPDGNDVARRMSARPPPDADGSVLAQRGSQSTNPGSPTHQQRNLVSSSRNVENTPNSSSSSSGFELFPNHQLRDVLLPDMTSNLDSQAMLQSILSRQEGLDALAQPPAQAQLQDFRRTGDAALLEQLQRQEAILGLQLEQSPQIQQPSLLTLQDQELQQLLELQQLQQTRTQQQASQQLSLLEAAQPTPLALPPQTQLQQLQQQPELRSALAQAPPQVSLQQSQQAQLNPASQAQLQILVNASPAGGFSPMGPRAVGSLSSLTLQQQQQHQQQRQEALLMNEFMPLGNTAAPVDAIGSRGDAANQALSTLQQQEALINELLRRRQQQQNNPQQPSPPQGNEDCKPS